MERFAAAEKELRGKEFLAPYTEGSRSVFVKIFNTNYRYRIVGHRGHGFGVFCDVDGKGTCARFIREADYEKSVEFLSLLPKTHLIACYETDKGWVAYPMNLDSARQMLGLNSEVLVKNVSDVECFDNIVVRFDGATFWYEDVFSAGDPEKSALMRSCFRKDWEPAQMRHALDNIKNLSPEDRKAFDLAIKSWKEFQKKSTELRLREVLARGGAQLGGYVLRGEKIEVRWTSAAGERYSSLVEKDSLDVVASGICLAGQDAKFTLMDLPFVMKEGEDGGLIYTQNANHGYEDDRRRNR